MKRRIFVVAAVLTGSQLWAQQDTSLLDEVVLTPNKFEQKQSMTGKTVTVIGKAELEKSSGKTLGQLLNEQAGLSIAGANSAQGSVQTVFMRGASTGRVLILIDGIPVNDPSMIYNEFDLNLISIHDIERIEICRGAQSTLYGSDAIAGVINIITIKKDVEKPFNVKALVGFGSQNTLRSNLQVFGKIDKKFTYSARYAKLKTDGFSSAHDSTGTENFDKDGFEGNVLSANLQYQIIPSLSARAFIQKSWYEAGVDDGGFNDDGDFTIDNDGLQAGGGLQYKKGIVTITGNYQYGKLERYYLDDSLSNPGFYSKNDYDAHTNYAELYGNIIATNWLTILAGFDHRKGTMSQTFFSKSPFGPYESEFAEKSLDQNSFYASVFLSALDKKLNFETGIRMNKHSRYGSNTTYTINPSYSINKHWRILGSVASGFKAPSIYQVYDAFNGNEDLNPEKSTNFELGIQQTHSKISTRLVYFRREIEDGIDFDYVNYKYFNFLKQEVNGLEIELTAKPTSRLSINANYTFIDGEELTQSREDFNNITYDYLLRRPKHSFNLNLGYQFCDPFFARIGARSVSERYDVGGFMMDDVKLDGYFLLSAYAEYKYGKHVKFFADLQNITGEKYFEIRGFNAAPFMINGGITINW